MPREPRNRAAPSPSGATERALFVLLVALHLLPLWIFPAFPSQDGPSHQGVTAVLRQLDRAAGEAPTPRLEEVFAANRGALPNVFVFWLLERGFGFASVPAAEKLLLTLYAVLLPLSLRYAVVGVGPRAALLSWLGFPFVYNFPLHMGFYNFSFSLAAFLFTLGAYWRWRWRMTVARTLGLSLLLTWVYLCHPVTLVAALAALGSVALVDWLGARRASALPAPEGVPVRGGLLRTALMRLGPLLLAALPALALLVSFVAARAGSQVEGLPFAVRLKHLAGLYSLASLDRRTAWLAAGTALLLAGLAALALRRRLRGRGEGDGLLLAVGVLLAAYFLAPSRMSGGGYIVHRLNLFPFLLLIPWLASVEQPRRLRAAAAALAALLSLGFLALFVRSYARLGAGLAEIAAAGRAIEPGRTLLFLSYAHRGEDATGEPLAFRTEPFVHAGSALAAARRAVDLSLYEANEDYFPVIYRPARNPYTHLSIGPLGIEEEPPRVDLEGYTAQTGVPVDYVLLWGWRDDRARADPDSARLARQLAAGYEEAERSPSGRVRLYRRLALRPRPGR